MTPSAVFALDTPSQLVKETAGTLSFVVRRTGDLSQGVQVMYATLPGTAGPGADYVSRSETLTFGAGESARVVSTPILDDRQPEGMESLKIALSNPSAGAALGSLTQTTIHIVDDEAGAPAIFELSSTGLELIRIKADAPSIPIQTFSITGLLIGESLQDIDYRPATGALYGLGSAGRLYQLNTSNGFATPVSGTILSPALAGRSFALDFNPEADRLRILSDLGQNLRVNPATGLVAGSDPSLTYSPLDSASEQTPTVKAAAYDQNQAGGGAPTLYGIDAARGMLVIQGSTGGAPVSPNSGQLLTVGDLGEMPGLHVGFDIAPASGTAFASFDPAGSMGPGLYTLHLATGAAYRVGNLFGPAPRGIAVVPAGTLQLTGVAYNVSEGSGLAYLAVTRMGGSDGAISATLATIDGTAVAGLDYGAVSASVYFADGETSTKTITVPVTDDSMAEGAETLSIRLSNATGGGALGSVTSAIVFLADNDPPPLVGIAARATVLEGNTEQTAFAIAITLSAPSGQPVTVEYKTTEGSAISGMDFIASTGTVTFQPGDTTKTIRVQVLGDVSLEGNEAASLSLIGSTSATLSSATVCTLVIQDDDGTQDERFVATMYWELFGRSVDEDGLAYWSEFLAGGRSRTELVSVLEGSSEYRSLVVGGLYRRLLGREADDMGLAFFVQSMNDGATVEQVSSMLYGSTEYFHRRGSSIESFLIGLYRDALQRDPDSDGKVFFEQALAGPGMTRSGIADMLFASQEYRDKSVRSQYAMALQRDPDPDGLAYFVAALKHGARREEVLAAIYGSAEYLLRV